jgi:hypothetical protein
MTWRALLIASLWTVFFAWIVQKIDLVFNGPHLTGHVPPAGPVIALALLLLLGIVVPRLSLTRAELVTVYAMLTVAMPLASNGLVHHWLTGLVTGFYGGFAAPTGRYFPYLFEFPKWLVPGGIGSPSVVGAFEGSSNGVPWHAWFLPLIIWGGGFFLVLFGTVYCLTALLYPQWADIERLRSPLIELPVAMVEGGLRSRLWWAGSLIPIIIFTINGLHHYFPQIGEIRTSIDLGEFIVDPPWRAMAPFTSPFTFDFSPLIIGIAYLLPVEVSFSSWFFFLLTRLQLLITEMAGLTEEKGVFVGLGGEWREWPPFFPFFSAQAKGGIFCLAVLSLWTARHRLIGVFGCDDDEATPLSPRMALTGWLGGSLLLIGWGVALGLPVGWSLLHLGLFFLLMIGVTRLRIDAGIPLAGIPFIVAAFVYIMTGTGAGVFSRREYIAFAFLAVLSYTSLGGLMMVQFEGLRMGDIGGIARRQMGLALFIAFTVGLLAAPLFSLPTIYHYGIFTLDTAGGATGEARIGRYYQYLYQRAGDETAQTDWLRIVFHGVGFIVTYVLVGLRRVIIRWPFHPVGYICGTGFGYLFWSGMLMGWVSKWIVVRYGSADLYRRIRPFFLGLAFGELMIRGIWAVVALFSEVGGGYPMEG